MADVSARMIGSIRRDCLDHVVIFGERISIICSTLINKAAGTFR
jgi:hypothetical protein